MAWSGDPSNYSDEQYRRACVLDRGGDAPVKERYGLPVRDPDGSLNCDGVTAARRLVGQVKGATPEQLASAKAKLEKLAAQCSSESRSAAVSPIGDRPAPGAVEQRDLGEVSVEGRTLHGRIPYSTESRDLGGWKEIIEPGSLRNADLSDLVLTINHGDGVPLARFPGTLALNDSGDGMRWSATLPESRADVREAIERGDLNASSWQQVVARDEWRGDVRHVHEIRSLKDVAVVTTSAYPATAATAELRELPEPNSQRAGSSPEPEEEAPMEEPEVTQPTTGGLTAESRSANPGATVETRILDAMRGVPKGESRSLTRSSVPEVTPEDVQSFLWDLLRDNSVVLQSGVRVVTTSRKSIKWPQLTQDMTADFYNELDPIAPSDVDFDDFELEPKKIAALARGSSEVFDDSDPDLGQIVNSNLATVLALKFDTQCLVGDTAASGQSKAFDGLVKMSGQSLDAGGALTNYDVFIKAFGLLAEAHIGPPYCVICHSRVTTALDLVKEYTASQANVGIPRPANFPPVFVTSQMGVTTGASPKTTALVYAPRLVTVVRRMDTTIEVDRSAEFTTDAVLVRGRVRATIGTVYPQAVVKITNIAAPAIT